MTACDLDCAPGHAESFRERVYQFIVGRALDGRRRDAHAKRPVMLTRNPALRGARHNTDFEADAPIALKTFDQVLHLKV